MQTKLTPIELPEILPWGPGVRQNVIAHKAIELYFIDGKDFVQTHELLDWNTWATLGLVEEFIILGEEIDNPLREVCLETIQMELNEEDLECWYEWKEERRQHLLYLKSHLEFPKLIQPKRYHRGH